MIRSSKTFRTLNNTKQPDFKAINNTLRKYSDLQDNDRKQSVHNCRWRDKSVIRLKN